MTETNGYHGKLNVNVNDSQLQKCSTNNVDGEFSLHNQVSLHYDPATASLRDSQSIATGNYMLDNMYGCDCGLEKARHVQLSEPTVNFKRGLGWIGEKGCLVNNDSKIYTEVMQKLILKKADSVRKDGNPNKIAKKTDNLFEAQYHLNIYQK